MKNEPRLYRIVYEFNNKQFVEWSKAGTGYVITVTVITNNNRSYVDFQTDCVDDPTLKESIRFLNSGIKRLNKLK